MKKYLYSLILAVLICWNNGNNALTLTYMQGPYPFIDIAITKKEDDLKQLLKNTSNLIGLQRSTDKWAIGIASGLGITGLSAGSGIGAVAAGMETNTGSSTVSLTTSEQVGAGIGAAVGAAAGAAGGYFGMKGIGSLAEKNYRRLLGNMGALYIDHVTPGVPISLSEATLIGTKVIPNKNPFPSMIFVTIIRRTSPSSKNLYPVGTGTWIDSQATYAIEIPKDGSEARIIMNTTKK